QRARLLGARAFLHVDEALARSHERAHRRIEVGLETVVAAGDDADYLAALDHRNPRDLVLLGGRQELAHGDVGRDRERIAQHARLVALHLGDLGGLLRRRKILVDDADPAFLRNRDREPRLGDGVHRRRDERDVELDFLRQPALEAGFWGEDAAVGGNQEDVIKGESLLNQTHVHTQKAHYTRVATPGKSCTFRSTAQLTGALELEYGAPHPHGDFAMIRIALFAFAMLAAVAAQAQVYKCLDANGVTVYRQDPCPPSMKRETMPKPSIAPAPAAAPAAAAGKAGKGEAKKGPLTPAEQEQ